MIEAKGCLVATWMGRDANAPSSVNGFEKRRWATANGRLGAGCVDRGRDYEQCFLRAPLPSKRRCGETMERGLRRDQKEMMVASLVDEWAEGCQRRGQTRRRNAERRVRESDRQGQSDELQVAAVDDGRRRRRKKRKRRRLVGDGGKEWVKQVAKRS